MVLSQRMDATTYEWIAGRAQYKLTELHDGVPEEKTGMSYGHGKLLRRLSLALGGQLDEERFTCRFNCGRLAVSDSTCFIPDVVVVSEPESGIDDFRAGIHREPASLVIEIRSPGAGEYGPQMRVAGYQVRGDREVWLVDPRDRAMTRWLRRNDGEYDETVLTGGIVSPAELPGVAIDLDALLR